MMKNFITFLLLIPCLLFGQATKIVTKKNTTPPDVETYNLPCTERYEVLVSDKKIKHGPYLRFLSSSNTLIIEGNYKNNLKDSVWTYYHSRGKRIAQGSYKEGKRVGIWNFYNPSGNKLEQSYDYDTNKVLSYIVDEKEKTRLFKVYTDTAELIVKPDCPPLYIGGSTALRLFLDAHYDYKATTMQRVEESHHAINSMIAAEKGQHYDINKELPGGFVIVTYDIDIDGKTSNFNLLKGLDDNNLNETALRLAKLLSDNWIPCIYKGKPIKCRQEFTMTFQRINLHSSFDSLN